jgi:diphosphomevalonate decarboxylase
MEKVFSSEASPNIAFIKYWGKRSANRNIPTNSSISMTLDPRVLNTRTSIVASERLKEDRLFINGEPQVLGGASATEKSKYIVRTLEYVRDLSGNRSKVLIVSQNSFPSGAGIASSASGAVALIEALLPSFGITLDADRKSDLARLISGSACRSYFGGIVKWNVGKESDGSDSHAEQVFDENYWPELVDLVMVVSKARKAVSSSEGHELTVKTSVLYKERPAFAEDGVKKVIAAVSKRDLNALAELIMRDSNNMHATMMDTWPPIMYLTDVSKQVIYAIHDLNKGKGKNIAGYTFDAGPNPHIITTDDYKEEVLGVLSKIPENTKIIESHSGHGPKLLADGDSLIDMESLLPKKDGK